MKERFWTKVDRSGGPDTCWEWKASKTNRGYGKFGVGWNLVLAHRFSYEMENGPIPVGLLACHRCDNPGCVNPAHIFLGTDADNAADRESKRRGNHVTGEQHGRAKLTSAQVAEIRATHSAGGILQRELARQFGVSRMLISLVVRGKLWKHTKEEKCDIS